MLYCNTMMIGRLLLAAALSFAALPVSAQTRPKVVVTFSILGDLVAQVAGDRIDLAVLVGADTDAHTYQPKPTDARTLAAAQAMVSNGLGFEGWIDRLAEAAPFKGRPIVATAGVPTLEATSPGYGHTHEDVAAVAPESSRVLIEYYDAVAGRTRDMLLGLSAEDLDRIVDRAWDPPVTLGVRLVSLANDDLQHVGQAAYVLGLQKKIR